MAQNRSEFGIAANSARSPTRLRITPIAIRERCSPHSNAFAQPAHDRIGKRVTPHTMRYVWAPWGFQVISTEHQLRSLAYAMGSTVETLRKMYERCTPEEKRHPIKEAIDQLLFTTLEEIDEL